FNKYDIIMMFSFYTGPIDNWLSECLGFILILNFGHWLADSVVEVKFPDASPVQEHYFGEENWLVIVHLTYTMAIYFRFHSVLMLSEQVRRRCTRQQHYGGYEPLKGDNVQALEQCENNGRA
ncbi:unnamed protein product, partial [Owenia fusiformis]